MVATATTAQLPDEVEVINPFHVVALVGDALDCCRQRVQQEPAAGGRTGDPPYGIRRVLPTGTDRFMDHPRPDPQTQSRRRLTSVDRPGVWITGGRTGRLSTYFKIFVPGGCGRREWNT